MMGSVSREIVTMVRATFVTCSYALVETGALVKHRLGIAHFRQAGFTVVP